MATLLSLCNQDERITLDRVLRIDIMPWIASGACAVGLYVLVTLLVSGVSNNPHAFQFAAATLYQQVALSYGLIVLACFLARRSKQAWTWIVALLLIILSIPQGQETLAIHVFPNSIVPAMTAMVGWLAVGRIVEYVHVKLVVKLDNITMSNYAASVYCILIVAAGVVNSSIMYDFLSNIS